MATRPTIIDVAKQAGVSKSTVSRVLQGDGVLVSPEAKDRVWQAVKALGYERNAVARSLRTDRTFMMMFVTPDITNPFWPEVARGVQDTVEPLGYSVVLANSDWDPAREAKFLRTVRLNRFDALIINPTAVSNDELAAQRIPTVILGLIAGYPDVDVVGSDSFGGTLQALNYLFELGHRRIGFIWGQNRPGQAETRLNAYLAFLQQHGLAHDERLMLETTFDAPSGHKAARRLLEAPHRPTAIFAANDVLAIAALQAAREAGLDVPRELSIIGMDDIYPAAMTTPPLTTMAKAKYQIGQRAAQFVLDRLENADLGSGRREAVPCRLVVRASTAPPLT